MGPARLNPEQEIYQAVDRGAVTSTTPTVVPEDGDGGTVLPPGTLITPPVIDAFNGFPLLNTETIAIPYNHFTNSWWRILNGSGLGAFQNSLFWYAAISGRGLYVVNLDNPGQYLYTPIAGGVINSPNNSSLPSETQGSDITVHDNVIYINGISALSGSTLVAPVDIRFTVGSVELVIAMNRETLSVFGNPLFGINFFGADRGFLTQAHRYCVGYARQTGVSADWLVFYRIARSGSWQPELISATPDSQIGSFNRPLESWFIVGLSGSVAWVLMTFSAAGGGSFSDFRAFDLSSGTLLRSVSGNPFSANIFGGPFWVTADGGLAAIATTAVSGYHAMTVHYPDGQNFVQSTYISDTAYQELLGSGRTIIRAEGGICVGVRLNKLFQLTTQGYQVFDLPSNPSTGINWGLNNIGGTVGWTGVLTADQVIGLYEADIL
jgi:hypothetical protein